MDTFGGKTGKCVKTIIQSLCLEVSPSTLQLGENDKRAKNPRSTCSLLTLTLFGQLRSAETCRVFQNDEKSSQKSPRRESSRADRTRGRQNGVERSRKTSGASVSCFGAVAPPTVTRRKRGVQARLASVPARDLPRWQ